MWDEGPGSPARRRSGDADVRFVRALIDKVLQAAIPRPVVFLAGQSNGAAFVEHLARHAHVQVSGLALITGSATRTSRDSQPIPAQPATVIAFAGTGDPLVPYEGGSRRARGLLGWFITRRAGRTPDDPAAEVVAAARVAQDWAARNEDDPEPTQETIAPPAP